jgi:hypothetical protein
MKKMLIEITEADVKEGIKQTKDGKSDVCSVCPTHQALRRYLTVKEFTCNFTEAWFWRAQGESESLVKFGPELIHQIAYFVTLQFKPGMYEVEVNEEYLKEEYK